MERLGGPRSPPVDGDAVLSVKGLSKTYAGRAGTTVANDRIDLEVRAGEVVALLGPNGAGKTTFLRQVAGQLLPTRGAIRVAGVDMLRQPTLAKRFLSVIPQECQPKDDLTAEEHLRYFALLKGERPDRVDQVVDRLLAETGLEPHREDLVRELSGGLRRRVLLAVALTGPATRLLLLDEPTTGVDAEARRAVWGLLDAVRARRVGVLLTTHYIEEAEYLADRVAIIDRGRVVAEGTVEAIRATLPYRGRLELREFDRASEGARSLVRRLEGKYRVALRVGHIERLEIPDPFVVEVVHELAQLTAAGVPATLAPVSLEDAYLATVGAEAGLDG